VEKTASEFFTELVTLPSLEVLTVGLECAPADLLPPLPLDLVRQSPREPSAIRPAPHLRVGPKLIISATEVVAPVDRRIVD
jgi:hypothetical protein